MNILYYALHGIRARLRDPGLSTLVITSLMFGVAAVVAVFQLIYAPLIRPLPFPHPNQLLEIVMSQPAKGLTNGLVSFADFRDFSDTTQSFTKLTALSEESLVLSGEGIASRIVATRVDTSFFSVFGVAPQLGTLKTNQWFEFGANSAVLSEGFWSERFGKDPAVLGKTLRLDDKPYEIVAVMPAQFDYPRDTKVWLPLDPSQLGAVASLRGARIHRVVGRLDQNFTAETAALELRTLSQRLEQEHPETNAGQVAELLSLRERIFGESRRGLLLLTVAVAGVLLIICINVTGTLLARGATRGNDLRIRISLGCNRHQLWLLLLVENLILTSVGATLGLAIATAGGRLLPAIWGTDPGQSSDPYLVLGSLFVAFGVAALAALVITLPCVWQASHLLRASLASRGTVGVGRLTTRIQAAILTAQLAITLTVLTSTVLMVRSTYNLLSVDAGYRTEDVLTARISVPASRYPEGFQKVAFFRELLLDLESKPQIQSVAAVTNLPLTGSNMVFGVAPVNPQSNSSPQAAHYRAVSPGYFRTLGIPLLEGRDISSDDVAGTAPVVVVNEAFRRQFFYGRSALDKQVRVTFGELEPRRIVGVVGDVRHLSLAAAPKPEMYVPFTQQPWSFMTLVVVSSAPQSQVTEQIRATVAAIDSHQPVDQIASMKALMLRSIHRPRLLGILLGSFAALTLLTAVVGVYGLTSFWVNLRRSEIGVRMAMGATRPMILQYFLRKPLFLGLTGVALGIALSISSQRAIESLLFEVSPSDPAILTATALGLLATILLASWLPAQKATRVDPAAILRRE